MAAGDLDLAGSDDSAVSAFLPAAGDAGERGEEHLVARGERDARGNSLWLRERSQHGRYHRQGGLPDGRDHGFRDVFGHRDLEPDRPRAHGVCADEQHVHQRRLAVLDLPIAAVRVVAHAELPGRIVDPRLFAARRNRDLALSGQRRNSAARNGGVDGAILPAVSESEGAGRSDRGGNFASNDVVPREIDERDEGVFGTVRGVQLRGESVRLCEAERKGSEE